MPYSERELFARIIQCEAGGEGLDGMRAVATVIMNRARVPYGEYFRVCQGSIRKVIEQPLQFTCMKDMVAGSYNAQNVWNMNPEQIHYDVADWAMSGNVLNGVDHSLWYYNPYSPTCRDYFPSNVGVIHNRVLQHCFYIPTQQYAKT